MLCALEASPERWCCAHAIDGAHKQSLSRLRERGGGEEGKEEVVCKNLEFSLYLQARGEEQDTVVSK